MITFPTHRGALAAAAALTLLLAACTPTPEPVRTPTPALATPTTAAASPIASPTPTASPAAATGATGATGSTATGSTAAGATSVIIPPSPTGTRYNYACADGKTFAILAYPAEQQRVTLFIEGKTLELKQQVQGSGTRHSDGTYTLVAKGVDAFIEQGGTQTYRDCKASRP